MKWLVTAFEPFGGDTTNSSLIALQQLAQLDWKGQVEFLSPVPVSFKEAWPFLKDHLEQNPHLNGVLALGQADGRTRLSLERVALNWIDARVPDNREETPNQGPILLNGPDVLWTNIPWEKLGPSPSWEKSYSAGTFVCNHVMYFLLDWCRKNQKLGGFVHLPKFNNSEIEKSTVDGLEKIVRFLALTEPS